MSGDLVSVIRDVLVLAYLLTLRVGVPILITLMLGAWMQRILERPESELEGRPDLDSAGKHCWDYYSSPEANRARQAAARRPDLPCWLAVQVGGTGLNQACYTCSVFVSRSAPATATSNQV